MVHDMIEQASYMAHGYCLLWKPWLVTLHAGSDLLIALAYFAIPVAIWIFIRKRPHVELRTLAIMFAAFIWLCGLTHIVNLATLWYPIYETQGWIKGITAGVSVATAFAIFPLIPKALAIPSPQELMIANSKLETEVAAHLATLQNLESVKNELEDRIRLRTQELDALSTRFKAVFENAPVAMLICDEKGNIDQANRAASRLFDEEGRAITHRPIDALIPSSRRMIVDEVAQVPTGEDSTSAAADITAKRSDGAEIPVEVALSPVLVGPTRMIVAAIVDLTERKQREEQIKMLMREVNHRSKNMLGVVQSIARHTLASSPHDYGERFFARVRALSSSQDLLIRSDWRGVEVGELVRSQIGPFEDLIGRRITLQGPTRLLQPPAAQTIGMALHELVTNAAKYGALSDENGMIDIRWRIVEDAPQQRRFLFDWKESNGPPVDTPARRGFGITMIETMVKWGLSAEVDLRFVGTGLEWSLDCPFDKALEPVTAWA